MDKQLLERDQFLEEIKDRLLQAQGTMKAFQDQQRREVSFAVADPAGSPTRSGTTR